MIQHLPTGIDLYYEVHGEGEPILLIPGTGLSCDVWSLYQLPGLSPSLKVVVYDQRGTGRSTRYRGTYTMEQLAADAVALLDHLQIPAAHIVGQSMGGRIALAIGLMYPERALSLVLAGSGSGPAGIVGPAAVPGLPTSLVTGLIEMGLEGYSRHEVFETTAYFTDDFRSGSPEVVSQFWDLAWKTHAGLAEYVELCRARHTWEATHLLGDVRVPTLVVVGDHDVYGRSHVPQAQVLASRIPGARCEVLPGQAHGFFWQAPDETNRLILDWVRELGQASSSAAM